MKKLILFVGLASLLTSPLQTTHAAISIEEELRPEYAPQTYSEIYENNEDESLNFNERTVNYVIADIAVVLLQMAGVLAVFFIIQSGFTYVTAFGREEEMQKAKKGLMWALIGLVVVLTSYAIVQNVLKITLSIDPSETSSTTQESTGQ